MKFKCECGQTLATDETSIGMTVECPMCKRQMTVPPADAPNVIAAPAVPAAQPVPEEAEPQAEVQSSEEGEVGPPVLQPEPGFTPILRPPAPKLDMAGLAEEESGAAAVNESVPEANPLVTPGERKAYLVLKIASIPAALILALLVILSKGAFLVPAAIAVLAAWLMGRLSAAYVRANAIRVSEHQFPELHKIVQAFAAEHGGREPEVYVMQDSAWNALAMGMARTRMVVLFSGAVDSLLLKGDLRQVSWLVGHELGHHFAGHLGFRRRAFVNACLIFPWLVFWYNRHCELTCDRYGLVCAGSAESSLRALAAMAAGSQMGPQVQVPAAIEQWMECRDNFFVRVRTLYSSHPHVLHRMAEVAASARELNMGA